MKTQNTKLNTKAKAVSKHAAKKARITFFKLLIFSVFFVFACGGVYLSYWVRNFEGSMPSYSSLKNYDPSTLTRVYSSEGDVINYDYKENRIYVPISQIPESVKQAFIAVEDKTFYTNIGIDILALCKAVVNDVIYFVFKKGSLVGGSTITQQVVKNIVLTNEKTFSRKLKEMIISVKVTNALTKDEILEIYLNHIFLGSGSYGVYSAALNYFGKELKDLTIEEVATLAALPKAPSLLDPSKGFERTINRRNWAIMQMHQAGFITSREAKKAMDTEVVLNARQKNIANEIGANAFSLSAIEEVARKFAAGISAEPSNKSAKNFMDETIEDVSKKGLFIQTTLNTQIQDALYESFRKGLESYDKRYGFRGAVSNIYKFKVGKSPFLTPLFNEADFTNFASEDFKLLANRACITLYTFKDPTKNLSFLQVAAILGLGGESGEYAIVAVKNKNKDGSLCVIATIKQNGYKWAGSAATSIFKNGDIIVVKKYEPQEGEIVEVKNLYQLEQIPVVNGSAVAIDPQTGKVLALIGGYSDNKGDFNRATQGYRQTGSVTKPFVYLAALENGFSPSTSIIDAKINLLGGDANTNWTPKNHNGKYHGATTLRYALERSLNVPTVRLAEMVGVRRILQTYNKLKIYENTNLMQDFSVVLGSVETNLISVARAFAIIANGGYEVNPYFVEYFSDKSGGLIYKRPNICKTEDGVYVSAFDKSKTFEGLDNNQSIITQIVPLKILQDESEILPEGDVANKNAKKCEEGSVKMKRIIKRDVNYQITNILEGVVKRGTGFKASQLKLPIGGKTGTTNNAYDSWFVGFSPNVVIAVHAGFDIPRSLGVSEFGATIALPIFIDAMAKIYPIVSPVIPNAFEVPTDVIKFIPVDYKTGRAIKSAEQGRVIYEVFKSGDVLQSAQQGEYEDYGFDGGFGGGSSSGSDLGQPAEDVVKITKFDYKNNQNVLNQLSQEGKQKTLEVIENLKNFSKNSQGVFSAEVTEDDMEEGTGGEYSIEQKEKELAEKTKGTSQNQAENDGEESED